MDEKPKNLLETCFQNDRIARKLEAKKKKKKPVKIKKEP